MIGLALIVVVSVLVASVRSLITGRVTANSRTSFYVQATSTDAGLTRGWRPPSPGFRGCAR
jgi:hypothetical protein